MKTIFGLLLATLMTAAPQAEKALALASPEPELTTTQPQGDGFKSALPQREGPVEVTVSFELREIDHIDDDAETFELTGVLKQEWRDPRQAFDPIAEGARERIYQGNFQFNEVFSGWFPQLILVNESGLYEKHGVVLRVRSDGSLSLYETVNAIGKIDLDLRRYPIDRQRLEAVFHASGSTARKLSSDCCLVLTI